MSTHNKGFYEDLTKIIFELSSNTHLISSARTTYVNKLFCLRRSAANNWQISTSCFYFVE